MSWLWQGLAITILGGLALAIIFWISKTTQEKIKSSSKSLTPVDIHLIEHSIMMKRKFYRTATAFYEDFEKGTWIQLITELSTLSPKKKRQLKKKWLKDLDFKISYNHTNIDLMRLQVVADKLTSKDLDSIINMPTLDKYGNDQAAGNLMFMQFIRTKYPHKISKRVSDWINKEEEK